MSSRHAGKTTLLELAFDHGHLFRTKSKLPMRMTRAISGFARPLISTFGALVILVATGSAQSPSSPPHIVKTADLDAEIRQFLAREISAHVADIKTLDPPPDRVVGALTTGEFSWGTFMRALGAYSEFAGTREIASRDVVPMIGTMALIELGRGGKSWAQLYAASALWSFGKDLKQNALWQGLTPKEREAYRTLLDTSRFYNPQTHQLMGLPQNYLGVAARIAAIGYELGLNKDRAALDDLLDQATRPFTNGALFADDAIPTGRFDRYSNEYARAVFEAAAVAERPDIMKAVTPSLHAQIELWWDLLSPDGYGYNWGRSLGAISYMDTMEIAAFTGKYPEFRPASLAQLASAYYRAFRWLRNDYNDQTHLLSVFAFGRGDYAYITKEREWQQTTTFFGKIINADEAFMKALQSAGLGSFVDDLNLSDVDRYVSFGNHSGRKFGVWVVRQDNVHFAIPFVTGPKAATSDYEPAPHGFPGFAVPVERIYPCLTPFLELDDGRTIAAADGADEIQFSPEKKSVRAIWKRWVVVGAKAGETVDSGLMTEVTWTLDGRSLHRVEVITGTKSVRVRRFWMAVPSHADHIETNFSDGTRRDLLSSKEARLDVQVAASDWPIRISTFATGDDSLGRGAQGAIPLQLILESKDISFEPGTQKWEVVLSLPAETRVPPRQ
jgi:hypothetical protein